MSVKATAPLTGHTIEAGGSGGGGGSVVVVAGTVVVVVSDGELVEVVVSGPLVVVTGTVVVVVVVVLFLIDPEQYRSTIEDAVFDATGLELNIAVGTHCVPIIGKPAIPRNPRHNLLGGMALTAKQRLRIASARLKPQYVIHDAVQFRRISAQSPA